MQTRGGGVQDEVLRPARLIAGAGIGRGQVQMELVVAYMTRVRGEP